MNELPLGDDLGPWPVLMRPDEVINLKTAVHRLGRTDKVTRKICKKFAICRRPYPGGPIEVSAPALEMIIHGDIVALELFRAGKRHHARVARYFDFLGLQNTL